WCEEVVETTDWNSFSCVMIAHKIRPPPSTSLLPYTTLFRSPRRTLWRVGLEEGEELVSRTREGQQSASHDPCRHCPGGEPTVERSEEHTSELQSREKLVCRLLLDKNKCKYLRPAQRIRI